MEYTRLAESVSVYFACFVDKIFIKMKILHVINSLGTGGAEKLVADLAPLQRDAGNAVEVLLLKGGATPFRESLEKSGIRVHYFGAGTSVYSLLNVFRLIPFLRKYDVVHVHLFPAQYWVAFAKAISFAGTPLVTTEHCTTNRRREIAFFRPFDRMVYKFYKRLASCSEPTRIALNSYLGLSSGDSRSRTIANGIALEQFENARPLPRAELGCRDSDFLVFQIASFRPQKDPETLIRATALLPECVRVFFVGDGEKRSACESLAESLGVRERVKFLGIRTDVARLLKTADVVALSSHFEGLSLSSIEGMASGSPFVASDVPGLAEVVGGAGLLFPQGDEKALAGTIEKLLSDKDFYARVSAACLRRAADFDVRKTAAAYLRLYAEAARSR